MGNDLILCGWRVRSALALPELPPWQGDDRPVDIEILPAFIPKPAEAPIFVLPHSRLWANGDFLLELDGVGRFRVEGGCRVLVEPSENADPSELKAFLLGSVLGALCHQRGLLPIHASAVRIDGAAVLIAGISGAGKSTLAAALGARGHALAADDVAAFDPSSSRLLPAYPQRKLARDVLETLDIGHEGLVAHRPGQPKFRVPALAGFDSAPLPVAAVYILNVSMLTRPLDPERFSAAMAMTMLDKMLYRRAIGRKIQSAQTLFTSIARLAQIAPIYSLHRHKSAPLDGLEQLAERIESHARRLYKPRGQVAT